MPFNLLSSLGDSEHHRQRFLHQPYAKPLEKTLKVEDFKAGHVTLLTLDVRRGGGRWWPDYNFSQVAC